MGTPGHEATNPLSGIKYTVGMGISQSGRMMRDLVYQGFNADEGGHRVFDDVTAHIAGSRKTFTNFAFAQPGRYSR
ncbi:alpha/beta hydrolase domain-containing protein [Breoghania sp.]|uniref:alpha/beta hydrolase domain-containing protein n=1 Tax=Breoghania sp. TaxID=2065378 RepID=UPI002624D07E|nr:alpha/beta hydrolase domain-containing protein [Breoghania sp.]MDJ0930074.1 alpha/beta hydrolase domain-containing protein [Breoghania sp.]